MADVFLSHTKKRTKQLKKLQKKLPNDTDRALVIQQLEYLIETFKTT